MSVVSPAQAQDVYVLGDFETQSWEGVERSNDHVKQGTSSGKWANLKAHSSAGPSDMPHDWSGFDRLVFWLYSAKANGQKLTLLCNSDNLDHDEGWDYFYYHFTVDWEGWKLFNLRLGSDIRGTRKPKGWAQIDSFDFRSSGWQHSPLSDTVLYFDDVKLVRDPARLSVADRTLQREDDGSLEITYALEIENRSAESQAFGLTTRRESAEEGAFALAGVPARTEPVPAGKSLRLPVTLAASAGSLRGFEPLQREEFTVTLAVGVEGAPDPQVTLGAAVPLPKRDHPLLFGIKETFARARERADKQEWARKQVEGILTAADDIVKAKLNVPDEGGQWSHHYVCKKCGNRLRHENNEHVCSKCGQKYTGWPYDQVVIAGIHGSNWRNVRTLGLAYAFKGNEAYAEKAREILLAYADKYLTYPLHNVRNRVSNSAARVFAQTLDEGVAIIGVAWGYDLIYNSPCLSAADREKIEERFLREVVKTIRRNNAGLSNWQSWHNAGIAAVGFCLQDEELASLAVNGKSGLRFQLRNSILADGFWYEGTPAYHYYALDALRWTTEAAHFAGIDFYDDPAYKSLYDAPLLYTFPDLTFPAVNDSDVFSIKGRHALYDLAYSRFGDPNYLLVAQHGKRNSLEALLWGVDKLPPAQEVALASRDFVGLGAAVLRQGEGEGQLYAHLDYGPHGGGHGHPDKLTMILFGLGRQLAPDPGRLAYGAPLQGSWYRQTFAHNTVCVDGKNQRATEGKLMLFESQHGLAVARAVCDSAYDGVEMVRTLVLTNGYLVDVFEVSSDEDHTYDWLYHNFGELVPGVEATPRGEPLAQANGYQHMNDLTEAKTGETWRVDFTQPNANVRLTMLGAPDTELYFGTGMANNPPGPCPMVAVRRKAKATAFVSVIEPYREEPSVTGFALVPVEGEGTFGLEIARGAERELLLLADAAGVEREIGGVETDARVCLVRVDAQGQRTSQRIE